MISKLDYAVWCMRMLVMEGIRARVRDYRNKWHRFRVVLLLTMPAGREWWYGMYGLMSCSNGVEMQTG